MTQEEAKDFLPMIQAYANGKTIEMRHCKGWKEIREPKFVGDPSSYRIKSDGFRPFKNPTECLVEMAKHKPFGQIKSTIDNLSQIIEVKEMVQSPRI